MTQGELEKIPEGMEILMGRLEERIMNDIVRRIRQASFSTASADWEFTRLQQLGMGADQIRKWVQELLNASDQEVDRIYSDDVYREYMKQGRGYKAFGIRQIPFDENIALQELIAAVKEQTKNQFRQITGSMGFVKQEPGKHLHATKLTQFYQNELDNAMMDIHSGAFDYASVLRRTIDDMTRSGLRWIDFDSGRHNRVPVAARRAVMTGFRQVQGHIMEQTAKDLHTDSYEVTVHVGARPTHQVWEGKVWTKAQLVSVCGLGSVTGLHGVNCYHDYNPFIPGVDIRTYTDKELSEIHARENVPVSYGDKQYDTYQALQEQRKLETKCRKLRADAQLLREGKDGVTDEGQLKRIDEQITLAQGRYQKTLQQYKAFSKTMNLPLQKQRIYQDGLSARKKTDVSLEVYEGIPKTWKKTMKISTEDAVKSANPRYEHLPYSSMELPYSSNCANCVVAAEMRFRGYDVIARAKKENRKLAQEPFSAWENPQVSTLTGGKDELDAFILQQLPESGRVQIAVRYHESIFAKRPNHTFIAYKKEGKVVYADPQNGAIIKNIEDACMKQAAEIKYCRIDNLDISDRGIAACEKR